MCESRDDGCLVGPTGVLSFPRSPVHGLRRVVIDLHPSTIHPAMCECCRFPPLAECSNSRAEICTKKKKSKTILILILSVVNANVVV